jgi:hypothetical protein
MNHRNVVADYERVERGESLSCCSRLSRLSPCCPVKGRKKQKKPSNRFITAEIPERLAAFQKLLTSLPSPLPAGPEQVERQIEIASGEDGDRAECGDYYWHSPDPLTSCVHTTLPFSDLCYVERVLKRLPEVFGITLDATDYGYSILVIGWRKGFRPDDASEIIEDHIPDVVFRVSV